MKTEQIDSLSIRGARVIDDYAGTDGVRDVHVCGGVVVDEASADVRVIEADGMILSPGLMDIHVHLRDPGQHHKECIETGTRAAAAGGFTFVACMPNTRPPIDSSESVRYVLDEAAKSASCAVGPIGTITKGRQGEELSDFAALKDAGAVALSDDGDGVESDDVMRAAFQRARELDLVLIQHCEYKHLSAGGVMHKGEVSEALGMPGLDPLSEEAMIERDIALCRETGGRYHVAHVSTARAVQLIREAKAEGLPVTSEVCTHHLLLTDEACRDRDPNTKMHPPLRPMSDVEACRAGLLDGTIDCVVTDHAPHAAEEKAKGFLEAPPGIIGVETAVALAARAMVETGKADWADIIRWFSSAPASVLKLKPKPIVPGAAADLTLINPRRSWTLSQETLFSRSRNTPFAGWDLTGKPVATVLGRAFHTDESV